MEAMTHVLKPVASAPTTRYAFLTQLSHTALVAYFAFSLLCDLRVLLAKRGNDAAAAAAATQTLDTVGDYAFAVMFVFTSLVGLVFWSLFLYDQELILPRSYQAYYPLDINLFQHGAVVLLMCLEVILCPHSNRSLMGELVAVLFFGLAYLVWTLLGVSYNGGWPYAFLRKLDLLGHAIFNLVGVAIMVVALFVSRVARGIFNPPVHVTSSVEHKKKKS